VATYLSASAVFLCSPTSVWVDVKY